MNSNPYLQEENSVKPLVSGPALLPDLRSFATLCTKILSLVQEENQVLTGMADYGSSRFAEQRKQFLQPIESEITNINRWRKELSDIKSSSTPYACEVKRLFADIQNLLMRILLLDRENQQAMLRRGLVPIPYLPPAAGQQPHFVADVYQRHVRR